MLYGSYTMGDLFTDALVGYGHDDFDNRRLTPVGTATSNHDGNEVTAAVKESYRILSGKYVFTPNAGLQYTHLSESGFGETGASGFDLATAGSDTDSLRPFIGASAARNFETDDGTRLTPELSANYSHDLLNTGRTINVTTASGSAFTVAGVSPSRDQVTLGAGLTVQANERLDLFADYDVAPRTGNQTSQTISAGLRYRF